MSNDQTVSNPNDFILQSFNVFDKKLLSDDLINILNNLKKNFKDKRSVPDAEITIQTSQQGAVSKWTEDKTAEETNKKIAISVGLEGKYGVYSGSVKTTYEKEEDLKTTSYNSSFIGIVDKGECYYNQCTDYDEIRKHLDDKMLDELNKIDSLKKAEAFTDKYGTHLVTGVSLGGKIAIKLQCNTSDYSTKTKISTIVSAKYGGINSVSASVDVSYALSTNSETSNITQTIIAYGGSANLANKINNVSADSANKTDATPTPKETINAWIDSCTDETVSGVSKTLEIWKLATEKPAQELLQRYCNLRIVQQSLAHPTILSKSWNTKAYTINSIDAILPDQDYENYKIIGGGAEVKKDSGSFLIDCYPVIGNNNKIAGWRASSHDIETPADPSDLLIAYAIAIYDPGNLVDVKLFSATGSKTPFLGSDANILYQSVSVEPDYVVVGGGVQNTVDSGNFDGRRYITGTCPNPANDEKWSVSTHDKGVKASPSTQTCYALGLKSNDSCLTIVKNQLEENSDSQEQHIEKEITVPGGIAGGGASMFAEDDTDGNFIQQSYPSGPNTWKISSRDVANPNPVRRSFRAFSFNVSLQI